MERIKVSRVSKTNKFEEVKARILKEVYSDTNFVNDVINKSSFSQELIESYANQFLNAKREYVNCKNCLGLEHCKNENIGMALSLILDGDYVEKTYRPCKFWINHLNRQRNYIVKHFSENHDGLNIEKLESYGNEKRHKLIEHLHKVTKGARDKWLFICGAPKSDKTVFAISLLNTLVDQNKEKVAFIDMPSLLRELSKTVFDDKDAFNRMFEHLVSVDTLVLDDFGSGYMNNVIRESFILPLIDARFRNNKFCVFTSRMTIKDTCALIVPMEVNKVANPQYILLHDIIRSKSLRFVLEHLVL